MEYGSLYIIPDENKILGDCFYRKVSFGHIEGINEFVNLNCLGYQFGDSDYQEAPCVLALDGHLIVKTVEDSDLAVIYMPEYITDNQNMWLFEHRDLLGKYSMLGAYCVKKSDDSYTTEKIHGLDEVIQRANRNNLLYNQMNKKETVKRGM